MKELTKAPFKAQPFPERSVVALKQVPLHLQDLMELHLEGYHPEAIAAHFDLGLMKTKEALAELSEHYLKIISKTQLGQDLSKGYAVYKGGPKALSLEQLNQLLQHIRYPQATTLDGYTLFKANLPSPSEFIPLLKIDYPEHFVLHWPATNLYLTQNRLVGSSRWAKPILVAAYLKAGGDKEQMEEILGFSGDPLFPQEPPQNKTIETTGVITYYKKARTRRKETPTVQNLKELEQAHLLSELAKLNPDLYQNIIAKVGHGGTNPNDHAHQADSVEPLVQDLTELTPSTLVEPNPVPPLAAQLRALEAAPMPKTLEAAPMPKTLEAAPMPRPLVDNVKALQEAEVSLPLNPLSTPDHAKDKDQSEPNANATLTTKTKRSGQKRKPNQPPEKPSVHYDLPRLPNPDLPEIEHPQPQGFNFNIPNPTNQIPGDIRKAKPYPARPRALGALEHQIGVTTQSISSAKTKDPQHPYPQGSDILTPPKATPISTPSGKPPIHSDSPLQVHPAEVVNTIEEDSLWDSLAAVHLEEDSPSGRATAVHLEEDSLWDGRGDPARTPEEDSLSGQPVAVHLEEDSLWGGRGDPARTPEEDSLWDSLAAVHLEEDSLWDGRGDPARTPEEDSLSGQPTAVHLESVDEVPTKGTSLAEPSQPVHRGKPNNLINTNLPLPSHNPRANLVHATIGLVPMQHDIETTTTQASPLPATRPNTLPNTTPTASVGVQSYPLANTPNTTPTASVGVQSYPLANTPNTTPTASVGVQSYPLTNTPQPFIFQTPQGQPQPIDHLKVVPKDHTYKPRKKALKSHLRLAQLPIRSRKRSKP